MDAKANSERLRPPERLLLWLFHRFPPRQTIFLDPEPRPQQEYDDECHFGFERYFGRAGLFEGRDVLDLGCGYGGRTVRFLELGARSVTGVETSAELVARASEFAKGRGAERARFLIGAGEAIPCARRSFDLVTMNDVLEHVVDPKRVLAECLRVLRPDGRLALVFPPYYDLTGGSHLHGYATRLPGLNLVFSTRTLKRAARRVLQDRGVEYRSFFREVPTDRLWNQNGLTVRGFHRLVARSGFHVEQLRYLGHLDHRLSSHRGLKALARRPFYAGAETLARLPLLRELFCMRICAVLRR